MHACPAGHRRHFVRPSSPAWPRPQRLAALVAAVLLQWPGAPALADSGSGVDTSLGNALNPSGVNRFRPVDPDGLGEAQGSRSPTGFLNAEPLLITDPTRSASGWLYRGQVEFGGLRVGGDKGAAKFGEYKSLKSGLYLNTLQFEAERPGDARFVELIGGALGRNDQYIGLTIGRYNDWRLKAFYNETDHVFTSTYRSLWDGVGTDRLTLRNLPAGPVAPATAASTDIAIGNAALATPWSTLSVLRQKGGVRLDMNLSEQWRAYASMSSEKRQGSRPFGLVSAGGGGTGGVEIPESIDHDTHELLAGLQWSNARSSLNLGASASLFRNQLGTQTVDNPMFLAAANGLTRFPQAVFDLYPDNDYFNLKAEVAHSMPELARARFTGVVSLGSSRQNDPLIAPTPYAGVVVNGNAAGAWNTTDSLSRKSAEGRIDTRLLDLGLSLNPASGLDLKAKVRHFETSNDSSMYWACNPLTGQWGRLINDGSNAVMATANVTAGVNPAGTLATAFDTLKCNVEALKALRLVPSAGNVNIASALYETRQLNTSLAADYRVGKRQNLSASVERETIDRAHREREQTWEDRVKLGYVNRDLADGTLRLSLEQGRRRGSTYVADPYDEFYSASFGGLPAVAGTNMTSWIHVNDLHRKFDLADRDTTTLNARMNVALRSDLDLALAAQFRDQKYPTSAYGRNGTQRLNSLNAELNWQPSAATSVYGVLAAQQGRMAQTGIQQNACVLGTTYYFFSDGSVATSPTPTAVQVAAGIRVVANSGVVTAANFAALCGSASPTSPLYPTSRAWTAVQDDASTSLGLGVRRDFGTWRADLNYTHSYGNTALRYTYNAAALGLVTSGAPTAAQTAALALIGDGMPDLRVRQQMVDASVMVPLNKTTVVRLMVRHETVRIRDWHYDGVADNPTPAANQQTYLDAGPQNSRVTAVGVLLSLAF